MERLRDDLTRCPGALTAANGRWTLVGTGFAGDESMVIRQSQSVTRPQPHQSDSYLAVVRVGDIVVIVGDLGYEDASGQESTVRGLVPAALSRVAVLR
jgi:hypothetical protein